MYGNVRVRAQHWLRLFSGSNKDMKEQLSKNAILTTKKARLAFT